MDKDVRLFFDVSSLLNHIKNSDHYTGIQRVVSMLLAEVGAVHPPSNVFMTFLDRKDKIHKCVSIKEIGTEVIKSPKLLKATFFEEKGAETSDEVLQRYKGNPIKIRFYKYQFDFLANKERDRRFRRFGITAKDWLRIRKEEKSSYKKKVSRFQSSHKFMRPGDRLILLDSTWDERYFKAFKDAQKSGCHVYTLVHDLIPVIIPETTPGFLPMDFKKWLTSSLDFTDSYLTVSQATRNDLNMFLEYFGEQRDVCVLRLAQDRFDNGDSNFSEKPPEHLTVETWSELPERFEKLPDLREIIHLSEPTREAMGTPYVLCVGTVEPRKNIWRLALAWKRLIDQGHADLPRLVIAGKPSVMVQSLRDLLNATGNIYGYVSVIESPSEVALRRLYQNCLFLAMPSSFEGWGLPVGEALSFGKTGVVSNVSSLPEVGGDLVEYCDPFSVDSIATAVLKLSQDTPYRATLEKRIRETELRTWRKVAEELCDLTLA